MVLLRDVPGVLRTVALAFFIMALARPINTLRPENLEDSGIDQMLVLDSSGSMLDFDKITAAENAAATMGGAEDPEDGKGSGLAEMSRAGVPVPPGFTIITDVCNVFFDNNKKVPQEVDDEIWGCLAKLEALSGKKLGDANDPLLLSVRSGAKFSMPGMMDTILNLGLNDKSVIGMADKTKNERFAYDAYRRFITMFSNVVLEIPKESFDEIFDEKKRELVHLLERYDIPLIENDVSGEIYFGDKRPMVCKAFDTKGLVMLFSSFSKDISPGLRVGWIAPGRYYSEAEWLKFAISAAAPTLGQKVVTRYLESGGYEQHLRRIRREYARNVELLSNAVMRYFPPGTRLTRPSGGMVLWVRMPENVDSLKLYRQAKQAGITIAPGYVFSPTQQFPNFIRLNAAEFNYATERAVERLGVMATEQESGPPA